MISYLKADPADQHLDPHLFEFFVYQKIFHQLDRGWLYCNDSISYCDIDHDLVDESLVDNVEEIAEKFGYSKIPIYCDARLTHALNALDTAWDTTTTNIRLNHNTGFNLKKIKDGQLDWSLFYDSSATLDDAFFKTLTPVEIANMMMFMGDRMGDVEWLYSYERSVY